VKAISIPGQGDAVETKSEDTLFEILKNEHDRVGLFVRSKAGEIDRRLDHLERQLHSLERSMWPPSRESGKIPPSRLAKYGKIEEQAIQAGEEIKLLSRFISAQRTAFIKLLKKYKKWSGRDSLTRRFNLDVVESPQTFLQTDLAAALEHWSSLLHGIRTAMSVRRAISQAPSPQIVARQSSSEISKRINDAITSNSDVEFDTVFTYSPLGTEGSRAVYWIHPEQLVELQVLLLSHTRTALSRPATSNGTPSSPQRASFSRRDSGIERTGDHGFIVMDNSESLAQKQNSVSISDSERAYTQPKLQPAATLMWTSNNEAVFCIADHFTKNTEEGFKTATRIKKKHFSALIDVKTPFNAHTSGSSTPILGESPKTMANVERARGWLNDRREVKPLVAVVTKRSRFCTYPMNKAYGQWCTLDTDIFMRPVSTDDFADKDWHSKLSQEALTFPYAVLEVRQEGEHDLDLIKILDDSHLVRVPLIHDFLR
jgi:SPX domain protein involved in polyphosphate accumulation